MTIDDPSTVSELLRGTVLDGRRTSVLNIDGSGVALVVECLGAETLAAWQAARDLLDRTGRWPVVVTDWSSDPAGSDLSSCINAHPTESDQSPRSICARAATVDPASTLRDLAAAADALRWGDWQDFIALELADTNRRYGDAPAMEDVQAALGLDCGRTTLDRWLFDWEQRAEGIGMIPEPPTTWHQDWFDPGDQPCGVVLLPTAHGWQAPAWLPFFGAEGAGGHERLVAVLSRWHDEWGAELVANWGTMLQFVVRHPPITAVEAYPVALAHELIAGATLVPSGVSVREHASVLVDRTRWFLHDRP